MNANPQNHAPATSTPARPQNRVVKAAIAIILLLVAAVAGYSIYVAVHEPDPQETVILGQASMAAGSPAGVRILVRDRKSGAPVQGAKVVVSLSGKSTGVIQLGSFPTDVSGSTADTINVPNIPPGEYELAVDATSSLGRDHVVKKVEIQQPARILLSSDKPIYQPGQTIHLRSLILNGRTGKPFSGEAVTFEMSDPNGNKVFKEARRTSSFGIASADFVLASELNLGRYELRAISSATTAGRTVEVKNYVLPKFKIQILADKPYYLPGETVTGSVLANYFFGQTVGGATIKLTANTFQEKPVVLTELQGQTDASGKYSFRFVLPDFFAGMPQKNEQAFLDLTAEVRDTAGHLEQKILSLSVAQYDLDITAIPEAGTLVPGVENVIYILTSYPDGRPAVCHVSVNGTSHQSDAQGLCMVKVTPSDINQPYEIQALDQAGRKRSLTFHAEAGRAPPAFLLRTDQAVYQVGQTAHLSILSPEANNTVFIDVISDGQTVLTKSVPLANHKAEYALTFSANLVGTLKLNAYVITGAGEDRGCSRLIYLNPASGLHIAGRLSQPVYRPGEIAKLDFTVTDTEGHPAPAALGIAAVDESVFALYENRPGLLQQFLDGEGDLLKPRYQIKFFDSPARLFESGDQAMAAAYFASLEAPRTGPTLDDMVKDGLIPRQLLDHAHEMQGTPAYQKLRSDPQYADVFRLLEGTPGVYSLREVTGPVKLRAVEAHRKAYFNKLQHYLVGGFLCFLFLSPVLLLIYSSRPGARPDLNVMADGRTAHYVKTATSLHYHLAILTLLPLICYPVGFVLFEQSPKDNPAWLLLAFETLIVLLVLCFQYARTTGANTEDIKVELAPLRIFLGAFLAQFVISRAVIVLTVLHPQEAGGFIMVWFLASIIAPLVVLGASGSHIRRQLAAKGINSPFARITVVEILIVISMVMILAAMLLPALASAKRKAQSISLWNDLKQIDLANQMAADEGVKSDTGGATAPRVRRDFPETLLWQPELITDDHGKAALEIPLADSITTWRASVDGISAAGRMGSVELPIPVFQDFFVDLDLPVSMSLGDQVSVPVTCYNYLKQPQDVEITLAAGNWFESSTQNLNLHLGPNEVKSVGVPITVLRVGHHTLRVTAKGTKIADAIEREVRVLPTGERFDYMTNTVLEDAFTGTFAVPADAIPASQSLWVKFYPSRFSEVVEGLDAIFQAPDGCFEQTSSTTYPNVLVLDYLKRMGKLTPKTEIKARKYINAGYQRLLTFEVPGGGFEWFGQTPAHVGLTAYGILEFTDMSHVYPVDQALVDRTMKWLCDQQNADGSWNQAAGLDMWSDKKPVTAYVAWALAEAGNRSVSLDKALGYLQTHPGEISSLYEKALAANAFLAHDRNDGFGLDLVAQLRSAATTDNDKNIHWSSTGQSMTYSHGYGMDTECTALCAMALMKSGKAPQSVKQALAWLSARKTQDGTWGSTQATILAMRALLQGSSASLGQEFESSVTVLVNGQSVETFHVNKDNSDVMKQIDLGSFLRAGENQVQFRQRPSGELPFQLTGVYWLPSKVPAKPAPVPAQPEPLEISLQYDRTTLAVNEQLNCAVTVKNNTGQMINMAIVDLGIPPGFDADASAFEAMQQKGQIAKFEATGNQVILYLRELSNVTPFQFNCSFRAKYPLRVLTPPSTAYEYYQPQNRAESKPVILQAVGN